MKCKTGYIYNTLIVSIFILNCSSSTNQNDLENLPFVTGIIETTFTEPEGTGLIFGDPSYVIGSESNFINVVPNPYCYTKAALIVENSGHQIAFTHLPKKGTIKIVKAGYKRSKAGMEIYDLKRINNLNSVCIFEHNLTLSDGMLFWDATDMDGHHVSSGFYRAFFISDSGENVNWIDLYLILDEDWNDPTGWISN